ncbi:hypothetical protein OG21DRAFT_1488336 [Imleria badia]|nr:hypothetical protein OG21DRAFT_1488336 [Imleria badia]
MFLDSDHDSDSPFMDGVSDDPQAWTLAVQIPATLVHGVAILATMFRLLYRCYLSRFSWEDAWATSALICDIACLASVWMEAAPDIPNSASQINLKSNWLFSLTITSVLWFARMSILSSVVRIANPRPKFRLAASCIGAIFLAMYAGLLQVLILNFRGGRATRHRQNSTADIISDIILVAAPIRFLRDVRLHRDSRILIISAFSASILITGVTILHSILLFQETTNTTLIIGHIKAALALFVCNALVLVTFVYRLCRKSAFQASLA